MKLIQLFLIFGIAPLFFACENNTNRLTVINSKSFSEVQITLENKIGQHLFSDSIFAGEEGNSLLKMIDKLLLQVQNIRATKSDTSWVALLKSWDDIGAKYAETMELTTNQERDLLDNSHKMLVARKWAELNVKLLMMSGEVRFGDVLEKLLYEPDRPVLSEELLKSVIYTHVDDQIFINLLGSSSLNHYHTTGGTVKLMQETDFPETNEVILKCQCADTRFMDVFIRIPSWAVNPTVNHGNVKYVALPGKYCQISRKWRDGDEFRIVLKSQEIEK